MKHYPFSIITSVLIWILCLIPIPETQLNEISFIDKWTHFLMYGVFCFVLLWENRRNAKPANFIVILPLPIMQGILVELAQAYLTTCRSGDCFDALCNTLGVLVGLIAYSIWNRNLPL